MKLEEDKKRLVSDDSDSDDVSDDNVDNKLELLKYSTKVLSRGVKSDITSDFVMAKFNSERDKEGVIEMTNNAYFCKRTLNMMKKKTVWSYDSFSKTWTLKKLSKDQVDEIGFLTNKMFDTFMTRLSMSAILNRNVKKNYILRLISGFDTEEDNEGKSALEVKETSRIEKVLDKFRSKKDDDKDHYS